MPVSRIALRSRSRVLFAIAVPFLIAASAALLRAQETSRSAIFVMGPAAGDGGVLAARSAAFSCERWLKEPGSSAELRRAGNSDGTSLDKTPSKELIDLFLAAQKDAVDRDSPDLISTLDDAVHALANRSGTKVAVAVIDAAPLSSEAVESLKLIVQYAADNGVHIVFVDPSKAAADTIGPIWNEATTATSGKFLQEPHDLSAALLSVSGQKVTKADTEPAPPEPAKSLLPANVASDLPVHVRFIQVSNRSGAFQSQFSQVGQGTDGSGRFASTGEAASRVEGAGGPLHGFIIVQTPLSALHFDKDDRTGSYSAHATLTQIARADSGKKAGQIVWKRTKDVKIDGPLAKFHDRDDGNLYFLREVSLPGGKYTLEATVEDVVAKKTGAITAPLETGAGVPGLMVSDAMFVKPLKGTVDKFDSDSTIEYQGNALAPLLSPTFPANTPFKVDVFFILYPDVYGPPPTITMEIIQDGKVVAQASMPFTTMLRNSAQEGRGTELHGGLQHGFDYVASMSVEKMSAADCQARLTITQGKNVVTRIVDFRVADTGNVAQKATEPKTTN